MSSPESSKSHRRIINGQAREVVFNVYNYFKNAKSDTETLKEVKYKTSQATGVSVCTIERVVKEGKISLESSGEVKFSTPREKRVRRSTVTDLPESLSQHIRRIIYDFHKDENCGITVKKLHQKIKEDLGLNPSETSLRTILKKMGIRWTRSQKNKKIIEDPVFVNINESSHDDEIDMDSGYSLDHLDLKTSPVFGGSDSDNDDS